MIEKSSQATVWLQFNMWSLTDVDNVPLTRLPVLGDTPWCSEIKGFQFKGLSIAKNCLRPESAPLTFNYVNNEALRQSKLLPYSMGKLNLLIEFKINRSDIYLFHGK